MSKKPHSNSTIVVRTASCRREAAARRPRRGRSRSNGQRLGDGIRDPKAEAEGGGRERRRPWAEQGMREGRAHRAEPRPPPADGCISIKARGLKTPPGSGAERSEGGAEPEGRRGDRGNAPAARHPDGNPRRRGRKAGRRTTPRVSGVS